MWRIPNFFGLTVIAFALCLALTALPAAAAPSPPAAAPAQLSAPVAWLGALGVVDLQTFDPTAIVTRADYARMLYIVNRGADDGATESAADDTRFTDISGHWAEGYVKYLTRIGVISDACQNGTPVFRPDSPITGYEMLRMALLLVRPGLSSSPLLFSRDWQQPTRRLALRRSFTEAYPALRLDAAASGEAAAVVLTNMLDVSCYYPDYPVSRDRIGFDDAALTTARGPIIDGAGHHLWHTPRMVWMRMRDGTRLAGKMWIPWLEAGEKAPVVMSGEPYRRTTSQGLNAGQRMGSYFAQHGYAWLTIDLRGTGNSQGINEDEYVQQEQDDVIDSMRWVTSRRWCTGKAGLMGFSWAGFQALQVAAERPKQLGAIVTAYSTDDRYNNDVHYMGGMVQSQMLMPWAADMTRRLALRPELTAPGDDWYAQWMQRLKKTPQPIVTRLSHQLRDSFWKHGSVIEDYAAIKAPALVVGGWNDSYVDGALRLMDGLTAPHKTIIGPWSHAYGNEAVPGPNIGFLQESVRWFDYWLKGEKQNGIMDEPDLRFYRQDAVPPQTYYDFWPGEWVGVDVPVVTQRHMQYLAKDGSLAGAPPSGADIAYSSDDLTTGFSPGDWGPTGGTYDWTPDQSDVDARSLSFTSPQALTEELPIFGFTKVNLRVASDKSYGQLVARLCDVAPDGASTLIARGAINLRSRAGQDRSVPLKPGRFYDVSFKLRGQSYVVPAGHKLRLAINTNYFPWFMPTPKTVGITVRAGAKSMVEIPVLPASTPTQPVAWLPPESGKSNIKSLPNFDEYWQIGDDMWPPFELDPASGAYVSHFGGGGISTHYYQTDTQLGPGGDELILSIKPDDPLSAKILVNLADQMTVAGDTTKVDLSMQMTATAKRWVVTSHLTAFKDGKLVWERDKKYTFPRLDVN